MEPSGRNRCLLLLMVGCFCFTSAAASQSGETSIIDGRIRLDVLRTKPASIKILLDGGRYVAFPRIDGYFAFYDIPSGSHILEVVALGYYFAPLKIDASSKRGEVRASLAENHRRVLPQPLVLTPIMPVSYYEIRQPVTVWTFAKNPMVLMMAFSLFAIYGLPAMTAGMDPEEIKAVQEQMKTSGGLGALLTGQSPAPKAVKAE
eukprot:TRINITY_DN293_c0_g1_i1.p1 TRINITY_DN293_c0_g1~~TRINITY_DN293_c0_g1_i1.p1  ORF type:complete len:204 (-),score=24.35 TRINITY_DN293_c0_g1_i1:93-704(-)